SAEYRTARIEMFYQDYLGRSVDSAALTYWLNYFASGGTENDFKAALLASPEYRAQFGNDNSFIAALYQDILGRSAEPNGVTYWADVMNASSDGRAVVVNALLQSEESYYYQVNAAYQKFLGRAADGPSADYWVGRLRSGSLTFDKLFESITNS